MQTDPIHNILIIDDDPLVCKMLACIVSDLGHNAICRHNIEEGLEALASAMFEVVLLDVNLPDGLGLDAIPKIRQGPSHPDIIIITGQGNSDGAEIALCNGVWDYIQKDESYHNVSISLNRVLQYRKNRPERETNKPLEMKGLVGDSAAMKSCYHAMAKAAENLSPVLVTGETGTGKELFARAIHGNSDRANGNLVVVDCAALPETLVESLLFGHEKGAFTGADRFREGLIAQAHNGTLFLDEVGEMPLTTQRKFLRVLQERCFRPVGGRREITSDFRLIAATNQDLDQMVEKGLFRMDLLYRLRALQIKLPALHRRAGDIKQLTIHYIRKICRRYEIEPKNVSNDFLEALERYDWPGNVRELVNILESVVSNHFRENKLFAAHLPKRIRLKAIVSVLPSKVADAFQMMVPEISHTLPVGNPSPPMQHMPPLKEYRKVAVASAEKNYLNTLLLSRQHNINEAMDVAGLSRSRFYELVKRHQLSV